MIVSDNSNVSALCMQYVILKLIEGIQITLSRTSQTYFIHEKIDLKYLHTYSLLLITYIFFRYEMAKKMLGNQNSLDEIMLAAFGAGSICTLITNPISVVRSRILLTDRDKRNNKYLSISSTLKQIIKNEGFQGLYKVSTMLFFWGL